MRSNKKYLIFVILLLSLLVYGLFLFISCDNLGYSDVITIIIFNLIIIIMLCDIYKVYKDKIMFGKLIFQIKNPSSFKKSRLK